MNKLIKFVYSMAAFACLVYVVSTMANVYMYIKSDNYTQQLEKIKKDVKQKDVILGKFIEQIKSAKTIDDVKNILKQYNIK